MFQKNFVWGVATSAYQIEGRDEKDGCGKSIWDTFCEEGKVKEGHDGSVACDHIHRYKEDIALMASLGVKAYRFSLSWARIIPEGVGAVNEAGITFYQNVIKECYKNGITPYITMYHWELPQALQDQGGWLNEATIDAFEQYAKVVAERFSDSCDYFITFNEPQCFIGLGNLTGVHAPGLKLPYAQTFQIAHNVLKAHGKAVLALRKYAKKPIQIGYAPTCGIACPMTESKEDIEAAREAFFAQNRPMDNWTWNVTWFSDPVFLGQYPQDGLERFREYLPKITKEDMELIHQPLDFMGQNIYNGYPIMQGENQKPVDGVRKQGHGKTATNWPVTPESLYWGPKFLYERYKKPIYITENGMACHDWISLDGKVHDPNRIDFLDRYLCQLQRASDEGVEIQGYFLWSFMDNFEWGEGYTERFGIVYVDYETQQRIPKDSAYWYQTIMESNGGFLHCNQS